MASLLGFYKHLRSGNVYEVISVARDVTNPDRFLVVYMQTYASTLRRSVESEPEIPLPIGTAWVRDLQDFQTKFVLLEKK